MDGIETDVGDVAKVVRVELPTEVGRAIAARYAVEFTPAFVLLDARGRFVDGLRTLDREAIVRRLRQLSDGER